MSRLKITLKTETPDTPGRRQIPGQSPKLGDYLLDALRRTEKLIEERMQTEEYWHEVWSDG